MDGCGVEAELPNKYRIPPENVKVWDNNEKIWVNLAETTFSKRRDMQFGPEMNFSHRMSRAYPDHQIRIIKTSAGGTKLCKHWLPDSTMYNRFITNINNAMSEMENSKEPYEICGMLWMQGESDSETVEMADAYEENLEAFFKAIREETDKPDLTIVMGRITSKLLLETPWVFAYTPLVQKAQEAVAQEDQNVFIINTDKLSTLWDNTHYDTKGQLKLGRKMAQIMLKEIQNE
jgi:hypothetical protein